MRKQTPLAFLTYVLLVSTIYPYAAFATKAVDCAPIRVPNLSEGEVETLLLFTLDKYIEVRDAPDLLDAPIDVFRAKVRNYRDAELFEAMNDSLGIDVWDAINREAHRENIKDPLSKFTLRRVLDIAKRTYLAGADTPLPELKPGTVFDGTIFTLTVPMNDGWVMTRCAPDMLIIRRNITPDRVELLAANSAAWSPFRSMQSFQTYIPAGTNVLAGLGLNVQIETWRPVKKAGPPCIETTASGTFPVEIDGVETQLPVGAYFRVCYSARYKEKHYAHSVIMGSYVMRGANKSDITARATAAMVGVTSKSAAELNASTNRSVPQVRAAK